MPAHAMTTGLCPDNRPHHAPWRDPLCGRTIGSMPAIVATGDGALAAEERRLARAAATGDGDAFATLYERYESRAYNLAHRITGSADDAADAVQEAFLGVMRRLPKLADRDLAFGSYLLTATRNACYDLMEGRRRVRPSDSIPESATPLGAGAGGLGLDPGDPEDDPDRRVLLSSQQDEIQAANARLPERQRAALALRELEELSYDEIAAVMDMNRNSVAQLISRARISLRDELRGTVLASVVASSPECERALPLIAMRDDHQLDGDTDDAAWLRAHLAACDRCRLGLEAMQEAGASYRVWAPILPAPWLFKETMARAAELAGADWTGTIAERSANRAEPGSLPGLPSAYLTGEPGPRVILGRHRGTLAGLAAVAALLLVVAFPAALGVEGTATEPQPPAPEPSAAGGAAAPKPSPKSRERKPAKQPQEADALAAAPEPGPATVPSSSPAPVPGTPAPDSSAEPGPQSATLDPVSTLEPQPEPEPEPTPAEPQPEPEPLPPPVEPQPPVGEPPPEPPPEPPATDPRPPRDPQGSGLPPRRLILPRGF
jgi:RNA polymerase sigma factor (sigma-70 family)